MKPYYSKDNIEIFNADCREILPAFADGSFDACVVDPVWPNCVKSLAGSDDPAGLFALAARHFPRLCKRAVVQLGCDSDPRFLLGMPKEMPFFRVCWLDYSVPSKKGRKLYSSDVAYIFGKAPRSKPGARLIPGWCRGDGSVGGKRSKAKHPCSRLLSHVRWLVRWFVDGPCLDCFAGAGTTGVACKMAGFPCVLIEVEEKFCERAAKRLDAVPRHLFLLEEPCFTKSNA